MDGSNYIAEVVADGDVIAVGAGAVVADSGALPAGTYDLEITMVALGPAAAGQGLLIQHRNAANGANIRQLGGTSFGCSDFIFLDGYTVALNERIRIVGASVAGAAGTEVSALIRCRRKR